MVASLVEITRDYNKNHNMKPMVPKIKTVKSQSQKQNTTNNSSAHLTYWPRFTELCESVTGSEPFKFPRNSQISLCLIMHRA